jgi:hypothetical protein
MQTDHDYAVPTVDIRVINRRICPCLVTTQPPISAAPFYRKKTGQAHHEAREGHPILEVQAQTELNEAREIAL